MKIANLFNSSVTSLQRRTFSDGFSYSLRDAGRRLLRHHHHAQLALRLTSELLLFEQITLLSFTFFHTQYVKWHEKADAIEGPVCVPVVILTTLHYLFQLPKLNSLPYCVRVFKYRGLGWMGM